MSFRRLFITVALGLSFIMGASSFSHAESFTTGKDWTRRMTKNEKFLAVFAPFILYHRYGVPFRKPPQEYISELDNILMVNPYLEGEDIANIFASAVYTLEPESRAAFDAMARTLLYQNVDQAEVVYPRLLLSPSPQPAPNPDTSAK